MPGPYGVAASEPRVQKTSAAEETAQEEERENAHLIHSPAGGRGQGGNFRPQRDAALVRQIHREQDGNADVEHQLLLHTGEAHLPIIAERIVPAVADNALEVGEGIPQRCGAEDDLAAYHDAEGAGHMQQMPHLAGLAGWQVVFYRLADAMNCAPD